MWLLLAVAALAIAYVDPPESPAPLRRRASRTSICSHRSRRSDPGWRRHVAAAAIGLGLVALIVGIARPVRDEKVPSDEAVVMLVVDVSASMEATDVAPSRLQAAQEAAARFVKGVPDKFQVGLISFDESTHVLATPTTDHAAVISAINNLETGPGTAAGDALSTALDTVDATLKEASADTGKSDGKPPAATIVLVSDGVTTVGQPIEQATQKAVKAGIPVTTIAYGTASGEVTVQGEIVNVPSDPQAMSAVADADRRIVLHGRVVEPAEECLRRHPGTRRFPPRAA